MEIPAFAEAQSGDVKEPWPNGRWLDETFLKTQGQWRNSQQEDGEKGRDRRQKANSRKYTPDSRRQR
jgi:hypothetical protein